MPRHSANAATRLQEQSDGWSSHWTQHFSGKRGTNIQVIDLDIIPLIGFIALVVIGIAIILLVLRVIWLLLPAAIIAIIVFFLTFNLWYTGIAFLVIAILTVLFKIMRK
jgi:hypothetical protein